VKDLKTVGIIPARFGSSRFPGKPLAMIGDRSMIERVYRQAQQARSLSRVLVATDDSRILEHVRSFGGEAVMTSPEHRTGTERCAEAARGLDVPCDAVVNIQGDEPFIHPVQIDSVASALAGNGRQIVTLYRRVPRHVADSPHAVKVVVNGRSEAMYFSRALIPFLVAGDAENQTVGVHVGLYGYRYETLKAVVRLPAGSLESAEALEQLRWLEHGMVVHALETTEASHPIDTPADLERVKSTFGL